MEYTPPGLITKAKEEKTLAAEKNISVVRFAVIFFNVFIFLFMFNKDLSMPWLAWTMAFLAPAYALYVQVYKPYIKFPVMMSSYFSYSTDAVLIMVWLIATGGASSPFYLLWYLSIVAVAFRFSFQITLLTTFIYAGLYQLLYLVHQFILPDIPTISVTDFVVRTAYIFLIGIISSMISKETYGQTREKMMMKKLAEDAQLAKETLQQQTKLYENLLNAQSDLDEGVSIVDGQKFIYVNNALCRIYGYSEDELLSMHSFIDLIPEEDREEIKNKLRSRLAGHEISDFGETTIMRKDGRIINIEYSMRYMDPSHQGRLFTLIRDVTEQKKAQRELKFKAKELQRSNDELQSFAYAASHDLQEPLRKIISFGDRLSMNYQKILGETGADYITRMQNAALRMQQLIDNLLTYTRLSYQPPDLEEIDVNIIITDVLADMEDLIQETGALIDVDELPKLPVNPIQMRQLFQNLISNALKFRKTDVTPHITIRSQIATGSEIKEPNDFHHRKKFCRISISDNGIGFESKYAEKIFFIFQRLHGQQEYRGTGIGLAICKKIAEAHNGLISATSEFGKGATFTVTLPLFQIVAKKEEMLEKE
jgi:two-component system, LuxR family, sensor kinase FixL